MDNNKNKSNKNSRNKNYDAKKAQRPNNRQERLGKYSSGESFDDNENTGLVIGRNAVRELLKSEREIDKLLVQRGEREGSIVVLVAMAVEKGIPVVETDKAKLDAMSGFAPHQGVIAMASEKEYCTVEDILQIAEDREEAPLIVIADGITDPYNLGALIRCAEGAGAHGIIIPKRRSASLNATVAKSASGALEYMKIARVTNLAAAIDELKEAGVWVYAADMDGVDCEKQDFSGPAALVVGSEGRGVGRLVKEKCDVIVSLPMRGRITSLNASVAAGVLLYRILRDR